MAYKSSVFIPFMVFACQTPGFLEEDAFEAESGGLACNWTEIDTVPAPSDACMTLVIFSDGNKYRLSRPENECTVAKCASALPGEAIRIMHETLSFENDRNYELVDWIGPCDSPEYGCDAALSRLGL